MDSRNEFDDIIKQSYKIIKQYIDDIEIQYKSNQIDENEIMHFIDILKKDERKNIQALGNKILRNVEKEKEEISRTKKMYEFDKSFGEYKYIAGVDEVGRGPLAGPIVAAAVILDLDYKSEKDLIMKINDSKKLSPKVREELANIIKSKAISYNIAVIDNEEIDKKGIAWCNNEVFIRACRNLKVKPELVLSDGYGIKNFDILNEFVIKGDTKSANIAAASIVAKVYRDKLMEEEAKVYPNYGFENHVGYGTEEHVNAIKKYGICKIHRKSFLKNILCEDNQGI